MGRRIKVRAIRKEAPDIGLYVQALVALARQLQAEADQHEPDQAPATGSEGEADDASR